MDTHNWLAEQFEAERPRLRAMAYRMLGSLAEAEDAACVSRFLLWVVGVSFIKGYSTRVSRHARFLRI